MGDVGGREGGGVGEGDGAGTCGGLFGDGSLGEGAKLVAQISQPALAQHEPVQSRHRK